MQVIKGKVVLESLEERLSPERLALLVVDMQNDFAHEQGVRSRLGSDRRSIVDTIPVIGEASGVIREAGGRVVWIKQTYLRDGLLDSPAWLAAKRDIGSPAYEDYVIPGTWGHEIVDDLEPHSEDLEVQKPRPSAFWHTELDLMLRHLGVESVVVCGCATDGCVEATALEASWYGYYVHILEGGVAAPSQAGHEAAMVLFRRRYQFVTSDEVHSILAQND